MYIKEPKRETETGEKGGHAEAKKEQQQPATDEKTDIVVMLTVPLVLIQGAQSP